MVGCLNHRMIIGGNDNERNNHILNKYGMMSQLSYNNNNNNKGNPCVMLKKIYGMISEPQNTN